MPNKQDILDNIGEYDAARLVTYIRQGIVTYDELCGEEDFAQQTRRDVQAQLAAAEDEDWQRACRLDSEDAYDFYLQTYQNGKYRAQARQAISDLKDRGSRQAEIDAWNAVDCNDRNSLQSFISTYPDSQYVPQAQQYLRDLSRARYSVRGMQKLKQEMANQYSDSSIVRVVKNAVSRGDVSRRDIVNAIAEDRNWLNATLIDALERAGVFTFEDLEYDAGIDPRFLDYIVNNDLNIPVLDAVPGPIESIGERTTEVYFWGIPASGKTCALGSIMGQARHGGYVEFAEPRNDCQGYHYMTQLSQVFHGGNDVFMLPAGTAVNNIFEMGYNLKRKGKDYPVTFIDLAGEIIRAMYMENAGEQLNDDLQEGLDTAVRLLKGNHKINRKMHFFVLEYNGHDKTFAGLTQDTLLNGALSYIQSTGIFKTETDAIYLLVTKSDLTGAASDGERNTILADYIREHYQQFYNGLKLLCRKHEINGGEVDIIPFSLGTVCFQDLCLLDNTTAAEVVRLIINRAKGFKRDKVGLIMGMFKR